MATRGENVFSYFTNRFTVMRPAQRVNVDLTQGMLRDPGCTGRQIECQRQAVIKTLLARKMTEMELKPG